MANPDELTFEGLDDIEARMRAQVGEVSHLTFHEVIDRDKCSEGTRIDFNAAFLAQWLDVPDPFEAADDEDELSLEEASADGPDDEALVGACIRWLQEQAAGLMLGRARGVFKVNVWKHKGLGTVCAKRFACVDPTFVDLDAPVPTPTVEGAPVRSGVPVPTPREWLALGAGYRDALSLAQLSSHHIVQSLLLIIRHQQAHIVQQNGTIIRLGGEHQKLYGTTARTLTDIAELKIGLVELGLDRRDEAQRSAATAEIGRQFVTELGGLGRVYMSSKLGLDPDLTEILTIVSDDERLVATLKDPAVREMLKDEATRKELALMLQLAAAKHKAQAGAGTPPTDDGAAAA